MVTNILYLESLILKTLLALDSKFSTGLLHPDVQILK